MAEANAIFTLDGIEVTIQCSKEEKMKDICQRFAIKAQINPDSFVFLYGGNKLNFNLAFKDQANSIDNGNNEMKVLVYKLEYEEFKCPKCGEKIKLNKEKIDEIIQNNNKINDSINGIKLQLENIIKNSKDNLLNIQLKNINMIINIINEDISKNNKKLENLLVDNDIFKINTININNDIKNKNIISGVLDIEPKEKNNKITLFNLSNTDLDDGIDVYLDNKKINTINEKRIIDYDFPKEGSYAFEIVFKKTITDFTKFFEGNSNIISLDLTDLDTSNAISMRSMFNKCGKLKEIKGLNKLVTNKVTNMAGMFQLCEQLEYLDLTNLDTSNVTTMRCMFNKCKKLEEIKGLNKLFTNKVTDMEGMFQLCGELEYLDLSNFDTSNVENMKNMFYNCNNLKYLNLTNFKIKDKSDNMLSFKKKDKCKFITDNNDLLNLYNSS